MTGATRATVAVVYDRGAVSAADLAVGLDGLADLVFAVPDTEHVRRVKPVLDKLGSLVPLTGDPVADAAAVGAHRPLALLTFSDPMLRVSADLAAVLGLPFHDRATALRLTDKARQRQALRDAGVEDVRSTPLRTMHDWHDAVTRIGLPLIVKPAWGEGSRDTYLVADETEGWRLVASLLARPAPLVVEEYLLGAAGRPFGDYVSVESLTGTSGTTHLAVTGKFPLAAPFREPGQFWPAPLDPALTREVLDLTTAALGALGVGIGLTHTEIKLTSAGPRIIEVNGRLGGHVNELSLRSCGVNLVRIAARQALGVEAETGPLIPGRVHYQRHGLAPVDACRLTGLSGDAEARAMPGVSGYRLFERVGTDLPGGVMTHELDMLWGACADHDAMSVAVGRALDVLHYEFTRASVRYRVRGAELSDLRLAREGTRTPCTD